MKKIIKNYKFYFEYNSKQLITWLSILSGSITIISTIILNTKLKHSSEIVWITTLILSFLFALFFLIIIPFYMWCKKIIFKRKGNIKKNNGINLFFELGDLLKKEDEWKIIPIDEDLNYIVDDEIISKNSIHGKFIMKLEEEINDIEEYFIELKNKDSKESSVVLDSERKIIYLKWTKLNENIAYISFDNIYLKIIELLKCIDTIPSANEKTFHLPLIGSSSLSRNKGRANINNEDKMWEILKSLIINYPFNTNGITIKILKYRKGV